MSPIHVDFTDVPDQGNFEPLEEGTYPASVFDAVVKESKTSGQPYINWEFKILAGQYEGRRQWYMTSLQPAALWKLKQMLTRLGISTEKLSSTFDLDLASMLGKKCRIVIDHEQYQGQLRDRVVDVLPETDEEAASTASSPSSKSSALSLF